MNMSEQKSSLRPWLGEFLTRSSQCNVDGSLNNSLHSFVKPLQARTNVGAGGGEGEGGRGSHPIAG